MTPPSSSDLADILKVFEILAVVGSAGAVLYRIGKLTGKFEQIAEQHGVRMNKMEKALEKLTDSSAKLIENTARIDNQGTLLAEMRKEINQLREGRGFIQSRVDGEYPR
jgi:hypothetical protein